MGRNKKFGKRMFTGNIHTRKKEVISDLISNGNVNNVFSAELIRFDRTPCGENVATTSNSKCVTPPSSSKKKL
ncbi:hypothetical protein ANN_05909 [Periplaneta americana]|uniref:Uncharacterized protein n=1 Tax=Periplaneta americana TaxID=6978 RepID=A0ABQ8TEJ6_PERAM|nr:hypothetical protein ANN_05909 [Periplaneta americana]